MAEASDFKFGTQLGFPKAHHKITPRGKSGGGLGLGKLPQILGFAIIFLQRPRCPLSVSRAFCYIYVIDIYFTIDLIMIKLVDGVKLDRGSYEGDLKKDTLTLRQGCSCAVGSKNEAPVV